MQYAARMGADTREAIDRQRSFYAETAGEYERMHGRREHEEAIDLSVHFMRSLGIGSVLDTGCGTGLGMLALAAGLPEVRIHGNDPSAEMLAIARTHGIAPDCLDCVGSEALPYADGSFDAVIETGMLHHVPNPEAVIQEMVRVAKVGVFLSDDNFFGSGSLPASVAKLGLHVTRLLPAVTRWRRNGHLWHNSLSDGICWDYSIFFAAHQLEAMGAKVHVIPTAGHYSQRLRDACPLLFASHALVAALKR